MTSDQLNTENKPKQVLTLWLPVLPSHRSPTSQERKLSWCQINSPKNTFPWLRLAGAVCKRRCPGSSWRGPRSSPRSTCAASGEAELELELAAGTAGPIVLHRQQGATFFLPATVPCSVPASREKDPGTAGARSGLWTVLDAAGPAF